MLVGAMPAPNAVPSYGHNTTRDHQQSDMHLPGRPARPTVGQAMITAPKICELVTTVEQAREFFIDDHVHVLLIVNNGVLCAVVQRDDLTDQTTPTSPVVRAGRLGGRIVSPDIDLEAVLTWMLAHQRRRLAVVNPRLRLLGLLCLKKSLRGFCSDTDVTARACKPT